MSTPNIQIKWREQKVEVIVSISISITLLVNKHAWSLQPLCLFNNFRYIYLLLLVCISKKFFLCAFKNFCTTDFKVFVCLLSPSFEFKFQLHFAKPCMRSSCGVRVSCSKFISFHIYFVFIFPLSKFFFFFF